MNVHARNTLILALTLAFGPVHAEEDTSQWTMGPDAATDYGYAALEYAILKSLKSLTNYDHIEEPIDANGLITLLGNIDADGSRKLLTRLTHYYIGAHPSETFTYAITRQGQKILNDLKEEIGKPANCRALEPMALPAGKTPFPSCFTVEERDLHIQRRIELIESGTQTDLLR